MKRALALFGAVFFLASFDALANPATDAQMANEALTPYIRAEPEKWDEELREQFDKVAKLAKSSPTEVRPASAFFASGLTGSELQSLSELFEVEVIDLVAKAPQGAEGVVMTMHVGMADLLVTDGNLSSRLSYVIEAEQRCFSKFAETASIEEAQGWIDLATGPFLVYSARVLGSAYALNQLQQALGVRSVMLNVPLSVITDYETEKSAEDHYADGPHHYLMHAFRC